MSSTKGPRHNPRPAYLLRAEMLLKIAESRKVDSRAYLRSVDLGCWESLQPRWWFARGKMNLQIKVDGKRVLSVVRSVQSTRCGMRLLLSRPDKPVPDVLDVAWINRKTVSGCGEIWDLVLYWIREAAPGSCIRSANGRPDLAQGLSGSFLRVLLDNRGTALLLVASDNVQGASNPQTALSQALCWYNTLALKRKFKSAWKICLLIPLEHSGALYHRAECLNPAKARVEVWGYAKGSGTSWEVRPASCPPPPEEDRDFRWPLMGPYRWSGLLGRVINIAPHYIRRYPRFQDYDSLRLWGLEFAQALGPGRERICYGVGSERTELTDYNFRALEALINEIIYFRRPDSPDPHHPYFRMQAERWLESLILEQVSTLFPELQPESIYSQIPVYLGSDPGRVDILGADREGTLVVMELKVSADSDLPLQALDYWGRVIKHNQNGDFERRGYFSGMQLNRSRPKIYLVAPIFSFHDSTERLLGFLDENVEVWKISLNEDWRCGPKILRRLRFNAPE